MRVSKGDDRAGKYLRTKLKWDDCELACVHFSTDQNNANKYFHAGFLISYHVLSIHCVVGTKLVSIL